MQVGCGVEREVGGGYLMDNMAPCQRFKFYIVLAQWMARELVGRVLPVHVGFEWASSSHGPLAFWPGHA